MFSQSKENKVTLAYRIIRNNISFGKWKPGDRFSSFEVAKNIGLGRTTVNDAIKKLEKNGFLRILPNVGFEVHEFTEKEMNEYLEVRLALEKIMTRYLVVSHKEETLRSIRERFRLVMASHDLGQFDVTLEGLEEYHLSIATILDSVYVQNLFRETEDMEFYLMARIKEDNPKALGTILSMKQQFIESIIQKDYRTGIDILMEKNQYMKQCLKEMGQRRKDH